MIKVSPFAHIYQQSVAHAFTICGICSIFAVTLIWIVQIYLKLLSCLVVLIIAIHFCMVLLTLTSQGFTCTESTGPPGDKVSSIYSQYSTASLHWLPVRFRILFKIIPFTSLITAEFSARLRSKLLSPRVFLEKRYLHPGGDRQIQSLSKVNKRRLENGNFTCVY